MIPRPDNGRWPAGTGEAQGLAQAIAAQEVPVPSGARARVWRGVEARRARRSWIGFTLAVPAAAAGAMAAVVLLRPPTAPVEQTFHASAQPAAVELRALHGGGVRLVLAPGSDAAIEQDDERGAVIALRRGGVLAKVDHRDPAAPLTVRAGATSVKVVGTVLWVRAAADERAEVAVAEGAVEVSAGDATVRVGAGERWPREAQLPDPATRAQLGPPAVTIGFDPPAVAPLAPAPTVISLPAPRPAPLAAESALYQKGWRLRGHGDARGALAAWQRQRTRFPGGVLRAEADTSVVEALLALGRAAEARREIDRYLARHPDDLSASEMHALRDQLR